MTQLLFRTNVRNLKRLMNKCPYCDQIVSRPITQAVESTNRDIVVLVSCPSCLKIIGVTRL